MVNSHLDLVGDQNDLQYLSIFINIAAIFGIYGTVPTYGTAHLKMEVEWAMTISSMCKKASNWQ